MEIYVLIQYQKPSKQLRALLASLRDTPQHMLVGLPRLILDLSILSPATSSDTSMSSITYKRIVICYSINT